MRIKITRGLSRETILDYEGYQKLINNKEVIKAELARLKQDYKNVEQQIAKLERPQEPLPHNEIVMREQSAGKRVITSFQDYQADVSKYHDALKKYDDHPSVKEGKALAEKLAIKTAEWELVQAKRDIILEENDFDETGELTENVKSKLETLNIKGDQVKALVNEYQSSLFVKQLENHIDDALKNPKGLYLSEVTLLKHCQDKLRQVHKSAGTRLEEVSQVIAQPPPKRGWSEKFSRLIDKIMNLIKPKSMRQEPRFKQEIGKIKGKLEERSSAPKPKSPRP